jgi:hypothetical protein
MASAVVVVVIGAFLGDTASEDDSPAVPPPIEEPVIIEGAQPDTGVIVDGRPMSTPVDGLPGGVWISEYGPMDGPAPERPEETTGTTALDGTAPGAGADGTGEAATSPSPPGGWAAPSQLVAAEAARRPPPGAAHFVDRCAQVATQGCPAGEPGTITPYEGSGGAPPALEIRLWPELTKAQYPDLRCDPGYRTGSRVPVVVTSNLPLQSHDIALTLRDAGPLDLRQVSGTDANELKLFQQRQAAGTVGADLGNGAHYCFSLATEGDPTNAAVAVAASQLPPPLQYEVVVNGTGPIPAGPYPPSQATVTQSFPVSAAGSRPPVRFQPLDGYRAQLVVPQGSRFPLADTGVWVQPAFNPFAFGEPSTCVDPATLTPWAVPGAVSSPGSPVDPTELARADYPYDRDYDQNGVWNITLRSGREYLVCVRWGPGLDDVEGWRVETPRALVFNLYFESLTAYDWQGTPVLDPDGNLFYTQSYMVRVPGVCGTTYPVPEGDSAYFARSGSAITETYNANRPVCRSDGWPVPPSTELQLDEWVDEGSGATWLDRGERRVLTIPHCTSYQWGMIGTAVAPLPCGPGSYDITLEWVKPTKSVCGNGLWSNCSSGEVRARMTANVEMVGTLPTDAPLDWTYWLAYSTESVPLL